MGAEKTLGRVLSGAADAAIRFDDVCQSLESLGFEKRVRSSRHLFRKIGVRKELTCNGLVRMLNRTRSNRSAE